MKNVHSHSSYLIRNISRGKAFQIINVTDMFEREATAKADV